MNQLRRKSFLLILVLLILALANSGCVTSANSRYFGKTVAPSENVLRYISGSEPPSLDPQISDGQPEARIYMALYDGLVEYDPKTMQPIPALAESWEISPNVDEFIFKLRSNARWSDGKPITAQDFVYSIQRGLLPETLSRTASFGYYIKYAEALNSKMVFVRKNDQFLLAKDFAETDVTSTTANSETSKEVSTFGADTEFHRFISSPERLTMSGDEKTRAKEIEADPRLKEALQGAEFVPVKPADIGVEAVDDYTLRITLEQSVPFFVGLLAHQFFRLVPQHAIEKHGNAWTNPANIVTCGAFKLKKHEPYHELIVEKDPNYWDAAAVKLDEIKFYPAEDLTTSMNLYKAGEVDAVLNHVVPSTWVDQIRQYKDEYLDFPEIGISYFSINVKKPPMDNIKVRRAFELAIDKVALAELRRTAKPLFNFTPEGIFPEYEKARQQVSEETRRQRGVSPEEWEKRGKFDPETARKLLSEAGYAVSSNSSGFSCPNFPTDKVSVIFNSAESNRQVAEFAQAQWKQNLGITIPLKTMEFKTFLQVRNRVEFDGFAMGLWSGDYMDPFTFLGLHYTEQNLGATGWTSREYDQMLDVANSELDPEKRYQILARAEAFLMEQQIVIPLTIPATNWLKKPYVKGLFPNPGTLHPWKYVYIERDPAKWDVNVQDIMK